MSDGVVHQVADRTPEHRQLAGVRGRGRLLRPALDQIDSTPERALVLDEAVQQRFHVDGLRGLGVLQSAQVGQHAVDHRLHGVDVGVQFLLPRGVIDQLGAQAQARERRAQVVRDGRERPAALDHQLTQPLLHEIEGLGSATHFDRAGFLQRRRIEVARKGVGRLGHLPQGPGDPAHRQ
jgi:hypothetical protein